MMIKRTITPLLLLVFAYFIISNDDAKTIIAGIAVFMVGMHFMEDGFKLFSGGALERILERFTSNIPKAIGTGFLATAVVQSSSLISIIVISFLSAELIGLTQAIGVIFGSNIGTTTTAWIVSAFGVKIKIAHFAMPMLIFGVIFRFSKEKSYKGLGNILVGLGFIFLGIGYMKEGFETLKGGLDLAQYAMDGYAGVFVYILFGALATVVIQSSSATMAIIITALATGQIIYINALALAIGANIGTTVTAILGAISSNENGKRLAVAHFIFNLTTGLIAIVFIYQLAKIVDYSSVFLGINSKDYAMKLALFHTIFNIIGVLVVTPFIQIMVNFLQGLFVSKIPDEAKPKYINDVMIPVPESAIAALNKEIVNLYDQSFKAIAHGMSLHRTEILSGIDLKKVVTSSKNKFDTNIDQMYKNNIKDLYSEIIRFASIAQKNMNGEQNEKTDKLKISARKLIEAIKDIRELQKNINLFFRSKNKYIKAEYDFLRMGIANALKELDTIRKQEDGDIDTLSQIEMLKDRIKELDLIGNGRIDALIREQKIDARMATSLMNDSAFAYSISKKLIEVATVLWIEDKQIQELGEEDE